MDILICQKDEQVCLRKKLSLKHYWRQRIKLKLSYFGHILRRYGSLKKIIMLGRIEGSRKKGRPNVKWIDFHKKSHRHESTGAEQGC